MTKGQGKAIYRTGPIDARVFIGIIVRGGDFFDQRLKNEFLKFVHVAKSLAHHPRVAYPSAESCLATRHTVGH